MKNGTDYESPEMELVFLNFEAVIYTSLINGGGGPGDSGGLPSTTSLEW